LLPVLIGLVFGSGASALIYQVLWLRVLGLVFGVTVYAATAVLASFMAGLSLGSALAGRFAERTSSPLRLFGVVEIGIGVLAFATQWLFAAATPLYVHLQGWLPDGFLVQTGLRFLGSLLVLLGPTTLMGMTLPLVLKAAVGPGAQSGRPVSLLYATNTAGALAGALMAGFYLIGALGVAWSFRLAAAINVLVGIAACVLSLTHPTTNLRAASGRERSNREADGSARLPRTAIAVFTLSGFAALALEIVWFRVLVYFVPATTYAFSTMLGAVLIGLATGSFAATPLVTRSDRLLWRLAWLQFGTALAVPLAAIGLATAYRAGWHTTADVHVSVLLAFPPAFLMGMSYPIGLQAWAGRSLGGVGLDGTRIGHLNAANLLGGILGAIAGGFIVLPMLGTRAGLAVLSAVFLVSFFLLLRESRHTRRQRALMVLAPVTFLLAVRAIPDMHEVASARRYPAAERLFWRDEGAQTTAAVRVRPLGARLLYLNGLHQASDMPDMVRLHRLIGHLPMVLHPNPKRAIVIGLGGGATPGAVSQHDTTIDLIELSPSVVEAAGWFAHINYDVVKRSNVRLRIDDGRNFLLSVSEPYDVVTADLIQPEHAGAGNLYSREYFNLVRGALAPGGLVLQWIGHRSQVEYHLILRTFLDVFPHTTLWADGQLLVGALEPLVIQREPFERKLQRSETREALEAVGLDSFERLLALYVAGPEDLRRLVGAGALLTDDQPLVEYFRSLPGDGGRSVDLSSLKGDVSRHLR
jgi:spermidine synthase